MDIDRWPSSNGSRGSDPPERPVAGAETPRARRLAERAAARHAAAVCDEIDRNRQQLVRLRAELEGAVEVCRELLDRSSAREDFDALARAQRILRDTAG
jgi:hypothetical protein